MDAIRKKMESLRTETAALKWQIKRWENEEQEANSTTLRADLAARDLGKRLVVTEAEWDDLNDKVVTNAVQLETSTKSLAITDAELAAVTRRHLLLEDDTKKGDKSLAAMVLRLAHACRRADSLAKRVKQLETKAARNEFDIEEETRCHMEAIRLARENDKKLDEMIRKLHSQEDELKRAQLRAETADERIKYIDNELNQVGESMKQLELAAEQANHLEDELKMKISTLVIRLKSAEARYEYGEMNITKLNHRVDEIEDEIYREKCKNMKITDDIKATLQDVFGDIYNKK